jgi:sec-independent protein translocase protein TatC
MQSTGQEATSYKILAQRIKTLLNLLRSPIGLTLLTLILLSFGLIFWFSPQALNYLQHKFNQRFVFFSLSEPFLAMLKFSVVCLVILFFPLVWLGVISTLDTLLSLPKRLFFLFFIFGVIFFYIGVLFAYFVILPYGVQFLLSFQTEEIKPAISLEHFANFFGFFLLLFGAIFELPLIMIFLTIIKVLNPQKLSKYRKEIFFFIVVFSAVITPTPDAINMSLLAIPLYLLFEAGLFLSKRFRGN